MVLTISPGPVAGETLVARAIKVGAADPAQAAQWLLDAADYRAEPVLSARSLMCAIRTDRGAGRTTSSPAASGRCAAGPPAAVTGPHTVPGLRSPYQIWRQG